MKLNLISAGFCLVLVLMILSALATFLLLFSALASML
jgi:hypothetical protein